MSKEWAWSFSRKKAYDTCPKRHYEVDIVKNFADSTEQLKWGNTVHEALANACTGKAPLPPTMVDYQKWVDEMKDAPGKPGTLIVEKKYAITRNFQPTEYFAPNVWMRGVCDVARLEKKVARARDYKTGKLQHDSKQLMMMATLLFVHFPELTRIKTEFVWLQDDCVTPEIWDRKTVMREWVSLIPEVNAMEKAYKTMTFPPKPGRLCRNWCPVTSCAFHKKGA